MTSPKLSTLGIERSAPSSNVTLLPDSPRTQIMNPSTDIDVTLPSADREFKIINQSTNVITLKSSNGDTIETLYTGYIGVNSLIEAPLALADWLTVDLKDSTLIDASLDVDFTGGTIIAARDNKTITISNEDDITYASSAAPTSASPVIPDQFRPTTSRANIYTHTASRVSKIIINTDGTISFRITDWSGTNQASLSSGSFSITYNRA